MIYFSGMMAIIIQKWKSATLTKGRFIPTRFLLVYNIIMMMMRILRGSLESASVANGGRTTRV